MTAPLHRALAALLGLPDAAALPLDYAVLVEHEPQAALERAWGACRLPVGLHDAALVLRADELARRVNTAWAEWYTENNHLIRTAAAERALLCDAIRAAVPCPVLAEVRS